MKIWFDGQLVNRDAAKVSVYDHGLLYGDGVFEGIRVYGGKIFQCHAHINRLFASADAIRLKIPFSKEQIIDAMYETVRANSRTDCYIRLLVTRGEGSLGLNPHKCARACVIIIADTIELFPPKMYDEGMPVIIARTTRVSPRMLNPAVKSLNYLNNIMAKIECIDANVSEAIMLNEHGNVCEGTGDNVFIVKDGALITPDAASGMLMGVTRAAVMKLARDAGMTVTERPVTVEDLLFADECFLTGTAAELIPVTKVDKRPIGDGKVGPVYKKLLDIFRDFTMSQES